MTEYFKGYIDDVRVTKGAKAYRGVSEWQLRWSILLAAVKNMFTGRGMWLSGAVSVSVGSPGITTGCSIRPAGPHADWERWDVTFDGKKATGYVNGVEVKTQ